MVVFISQKTKYKSKETVIISSFAKDILIKGKDRITKKGGPAKFIKQVFELNKKNFSLITPKKEFIVEIKIKNNQEFGKIIKSYKVKNNKIPENSNILISTIIDEFDLANLEKTKGIIGLDLQGYVRDGKNFGRKKYFDDFKKFYRKIDILKVTLEESRYINPKILKKIPLVIITNGQKPGKILEKGIKIEQIYPSKIITDETLGAGDTFFSSFFISFCEDKDIKKAKDFALDSVNKFLKSKIEKFDCIEFLKKIIDINSSKSKSNKEVIDYLSQIFENYEKIKVKQINKNLVLYNLIVKNNSKNKDKSKKPIVFIMHTDTVDGNWFSKTTENKTKIFGLGACDMKGPIASVCGAFLEKDFDRDIYLIFTSDEESYAKGGVILKKYLKLKKAICIVPEPTSGRIFINQNSCVSYKIKIYGIQKHASLAGYNFNKKNNASYRAIKICNYLINYEKVSNELSSQNIVFSSQLSSSNVTPKEVLINIDQRFKPGVDYEKISKDIKKKLLILGAKNVKISFSKGGFENKNLSLKNKFKKIVSFYFKTEFGNYKAWTEAGTFYDIGDTFIFGPGKIENAHKINEFILKEEVLEFKNIYLDLIETL